MRIGREDESEVRIHVELEQLIDFTFEIRQHANRQMTVGKENPVTNIGSSRQDLLRPLSLSLTHGDCLKWNTFFFGESLQLISGIHTRTEYDDQWCFGAGFFDDVFELYWNTLDKVFLHEVLYVVSDGIVDSIFSETPQNDHLLELAFALGVPFSWQGSSFRWMRFDRVVPFVPILWIGCNAIRDLLESFWDRLLKLCDIVPSVLRDPVERWLRRLQRSVKNLTTNKEEVPFILINHSLRHLKFYAHLHGQEQLMLLEERLASLLVDMLCVIGSNRFNLVATNSLILDILD